MKVRNLIEKLQKLDPDLEVWVQIAEGCRSTASSVEVESIDTESVNGATASDGTPVALIWPEGL